MGIHCLVYVDGSMSGESFTFAAVPSVGDAVQLSRLDLQTLWVTSVLHVAKGTYDASPEAHVQLNVTTKRSA